MHAVLLAAGEGSRLRPLTDDVPKPMLPIDGEAVVLRVLRQLCAAGCVEATVIVGYLGDRLRAFLEGRDVGVELRFVEQPTRDGSAHALQCALADGMPRTSTVTIATDTWYRDEDVHAIVEDFGRGGATVTMGVRRWPLEQLPHRSCVSMDAAGRIQRVIEKPTAQEVTSALSGSPIYVWDAAFWERVANVRPSAHGKLELATALQAAIDAGETVRAVEVCDTRDITTPADLLAHNFPYLEPFLSDDGGVAEEKSGGGSDRNRPH